jgi:HPt (histidine-containing phosphotransfer) domain-containing protein
MLKDHRLNGNKKLAFKVLSLYVENAEKLLQEMNKKFEQKFWEELSRTAHSLKGSSLNVGANKLAKSAFGLEVGAKRGSNPGLIEAWIEMCKNGLNEVEPLVQDYLNS